MDNIFHYVFRPDVQAIFDHFCALLKVRIVFFSPAGEELRVGLTKPNCDYCRMLRHEFGYEPVCRNLDQTRRAEAARTGCLVVYSCHASLHEAIMPVMAERDLLGFIMIGQFRTVDKMPAGLIERNASPDRRVALAEAFRQVPYLPDHQLDHLLGLFGVLVGFIVSQQLIGRPDRGAVQTVLTWLHEHVTENTRLIDAAALVGRSPSTLSHLFHKVLGKGFKHVQIEIKLDLAEQYLRTIPGITVSEVAYRLGFVDPLYFSRLFKRYRKIPPSACLRKPQDDGAPTPPGMVNPSH